MAARLRTYQQDEVRAKIQTTQLINRLTGIATGEITGDGLGVQVTAALGLLKKVLPDLASTELSGDAANPVVVRQRIERVIVDPADSDRPRIPPTA